MALHKNMTCDQMVTFIDNELLPQTKLEIGNWIHPRKKTGGYFIVARQLFCMIDFFGAVYSGYQLSERKQDPNGRRIATSRKAIKFITDFFEPQSVYNTKVVTQIHDMYRNGLVHLYQPKRLKLNTKKHLRWFIYRGKRYLNKVSVGSNQGKFIFRNVNHLQVKRSEINKNIYYLPTSIDCLYDDFVKAVTKYRNKLLKTKYLQTNWRTTVNAICKPR